MIPFSHDLYHLCLCHFGLCLDHSFHGLYPYLYLYPDLCLYLYLYPYPCPESLTYGLYHHDRRVPHDHHGHDFPFVYL